MSLKQRIVDDLTAAMKKQGRCSPEYPSHG